MRTLVFLHGALGCKNHWEPVGNLLEENFAVYNLNFPAHGSQPPLRKGVYENFESLTDFVRNEIEKLQLKDFTIIGYSLGGYVGLKLAIDQLQGLSKLITLGTKTHWSIEIANEENKRLNTESLKPIVEKLEKEHCLPVEELLKHTQSILSDIGSHPILLQDLNAIQIPVCMLLGEKDKMVTKEETIQFTEAMNNAKLIPLPDQGHLLERIDAAVLTNALKHAF